MPSKIAVIGLGFGDEGKGLLTNYLCLQYPDAIVVRYSGGQQAGHTVVKDGIRHVFSNFGSGTLNGNTTYWSKNCTVDPVGIYREYLTLKRLGITPKLIINPNCPVTTAGDKFLNRKKDQKHGTCGVGVGTTWERELRHFSLLYKDLFNPTILAIKLELISKHWSPFYIPDLLEYIEGIKNIPTIEMGIIPMVENYIFEGSQGLLLDQDIGFFPHVTRSSTGSAGVYKVVNPPVEFVGVIRAYQTRHGLGPMTNLSIEHNIKINPLETNVTNEFQGEFNRSVLDLDLIKYGISRDFGLNRQRDTLAITCLDHVEYSWKFTLNGKLFTFLTEHEFVLAINKELGFKKVLLSHCDESEKITKF